jgi:hypothetical protein
MPSYDPTGYYYAQVLPQIPPPSPLKERPISVNDRVTIEHLLVALGVTMAYRQDLDDGTRVYAVAIRFLPRLRKDPGGYFLEFNNKRYYFQAYDPSGIRPLLREWQVLT